MRQSASAGAPPVRPRDRHALELDQVVSAAFRDNPPEGSGRTPGPVGGGRTSRAGVPRNVRPQRAEKRLAAGRNHPRRLVCALLPLLIIMPPSRGRGGRDEAVGAALPVALERT